MKKFFTILLGVALPLAVVAQEVVQTDSLTVMPAETEIEAPEETPEKEPALMPHQVRLGWGDMMFETAVFHPGLAADGNRTHHYGYTGHIFAGYAYSFRKWVSFGAEIDFEGIFWKETPCDQYRRPIGDAIPVRNYDLTIMPEVRFTFFDKGWVNLYAGLGVGALIAFDNHKGVEASPAVNLNLFGVWMGKDHWGGSLELGALNALMGKDRIYMLGSRLISVSVNYRW